jgi:hypothetical protein
MTANIKRQSGEHIVAPHHGTHPAGCRGKLDPDTRVLAGPPPAGRTSTAVLIDPSLGASFLRYAIQRPSGDHIGLEKFRRPFPIASFRGALPSTPLTQTSAPYVSKLPLIKAIDRPSGEIAGNTPGLYTLRSGSPPVNGMTQMAYPSGVTKSASTFPLAGNHRSPPCGWTPQLPRGTAIGRVAPESIVRNRKPAWSRYAICLPSEEMAQPKPSLPSDWM